MYTPKQRIDITYYDSKPHDYQGSGSITRFIGCPTKKVRKEGRKRDLSSSRVTDNKDKSTSTYGGVNRV